MATLPQRQQHPNQCNQKGRTAYPKLGEGQKEKHTQTHSHYLPHTQIQDPMRTAYVAGNSVEMIQRHYLNMNVPKDDIKRFFELTPTKAKDIGIID